jgi:tetratricopeptide (TPR) repeat protein
VAQPVGFERAPWQVRIRRQLNQLPAGGGMFCGDGYVVTCAHVISQDAAAPVGPVYVEFQHAGRHEPIPALVAEGGWLPAAQDDGGMSRDVAVLRLQADPPPEAAPAPLRPTPEGAAVPHKFYAYGYPRRLARGGVPARGTIVGQAGDEWLSLSPEVGGQGLEPGFSGSPVWDIAVQGVVGIVVVRDGPRPSGDRDAIASRTAYAIRMETVVRYWPPLRDLLEVGPADSLEELLDIGLAEGGRLPVVAETSVYAMGVTESKYVSAENPEPPYVPRAWVDAEIRRLLDAGERFVLAVGDSKSGKSRSMAEMLRRLRPQAQLIVPAVGDPTALPKLARLPLPARAEGSVLWLDDIDRYLGPGGLDLKVLLAFQQQEATVVGTITARRYHDLVTARTAAGAHDVRGMTDAAAQAGRLLLRAKVVRVASSPSPEDLAAARELYPEEDFRTRGIGEQMVAAPMIEDLYAAARESCPEGWAVVQAAVDWRRIGVAGPVSRQILRSLFPRYLFEAAPHLDPGDARFADGVDWACRPLSGTIALLSRARPGQEQVAYHAFDYVLACAEGQGPFEPIPVAVHAWDEAIGSLGADELLAITQAAVARDEMTIARRAADAARRSGDDATVALANVMLAELLAAAGDIGAALELLELAADSGIPDVVPMAEVDLGTFLSLTDGDSDRARALLESAMRADDAQIAAQARLNLGVVLMNRGELSEARPLLEAAMAAHADLADDPFRGLSGQELVERTRVPPKEAHLVGHRDEPATGTTAVTGDQSRALQAVAARRAESVHLLAQASLGGLLANEGDLQQARMLLDAAISSGNPDVVPLARTNLGALLLRSGDLQAAREEFERVLGFGATEVASFAQISLGCVLAAMGDAEAGRELLEEVAASDDAGQAPRALCLLGELYLDDDWEAAQSCLDRVVQSGHPDWAPYASVSIGMLRARKGDVAGAREQLEGVIAARHPGESARAADLLGDILLNTGDLQGAAGAYRSSIDFHHPWWSLVATIDLARVRARQDAVDESIELLQSVISGGDPNATPMAQDLLGDLLRFSIGDPDGAREAYQRAIDSGHPEWSVTAAFGLAQLLEAEADPEGAQAQLRLIAEGANQIQAAGAWDLLGDLLVRTEDNAGARAAYQRAIDSRVPHWPAVARVDLARLILAEADDASEAEALNAVDEAEPLLTAAADGIPEVAASAHLILGMIALFRDDPVRAEDEFWQAADAGTPPVAGTALMQIAKLCIGDDDLTQAAEILEHLLDGSFDDEGLKQYASAYLGGVRLRQGDPDAAMSLLRRGADSQDPDTAAYSCLTWGMYLFEIGDIDAADEILTAALEIGYAEVADSVRAGLGMIRLAQRRLDEAYVLLKGVLDSGDKDEEAKVRRYLGSVLARQGRPAEARAVLEPLAASGDTEHRPAGLLLLGRLAWQDKDTGDARRWLTAAIEAGDREVEAEARSELGQMLAQAGEIEASREVLSPLLGQTGAASRQAEEFLGTLSSVQSAAGPAPAPRRAIAGRRAGPAVTTSTSPAPVPGKPPRPGLTPLPPVVLALLAEVADADGQPAEAEYWRSILPRAQGPAGASPVGG